VFQGMKKVFISEPVLAVPDLNRKIQIKVNASNYVTEEVLSVKCENGKWRPVAFISKLINSTKRNYEIHNKEMLAVIRCLKV